MNGVLIMQWKLILLDLFSASKHTTDFSTNRGRILYHRVRLIAVMMGVLSVLWIPIDYFALEAQQFSQVLWVRLTWIVGFLLFAFGWEGDGRSLIKGFLRLYFMVALFAVSYFYLWVHVFDPAVQNDFSAGYSFIPYVAIVMLAVFPLTILEAGLCILTMTLFVLAVDLQAETILALPVWIKLWFIAVISGIILWASASQLHGLMVLYREATRDVVTGLINRRLILDEMERIRESLSGRGATGAVLLADLDRFKKINDEYGHLNGDLVLRDFADAIVHMHPALTIAGRFGGEEFLMILEKVERDEVIAIANNLNELIRKRLVIGLDHEQIRYTTSIGIAEFVEGESEQSLLERADNALYEAKGAGRDCAVMAPLPEIETAS